MSNFKSIGYSSCHHGTRTNVLRLTNNTVIVSRITALAELEIDYSVRISSFVELGTYVRKYWGLEQALRSDLTYTVNRASAQQAILQPMERAGALALPCATSTVDSTR